MDPHVLLFVFLNFPPTSKSLGLFFFLSLWCHTELLFSFFFFKWNFLYIFGSSKKSPHFPLVVATSCRIIYKKVNSGGGKIKPTKCKSSFIKHFSSNLLKKSVQSSERDVCSFHKPVFPYLLQIVYLSSSIYWCAVWAGR